MNLPGTVIRLSIGENLALVVRMPMEVYGETELVGVLTDEQGNKVLNRDGCYIWAGDNMVRIKEGKFSFKGKDLFSF